MAVAVAVVQAEGSVTSAVVVVEVRTSAGAKAAIARLCHALGVAANCLHKEQPPASKQKAGVSSGGDSVETRRLLTQNPDVGMGCSLSAEAPPS